MAQREQFQFFTLFQRTTAVLDDDAMVLLDHQYTKDRIRRIPFDQMDYLLHWKGPATARLLGLLSMTLLILIAGLSILGNMSRNDSFAEGFAIFLLLLAVLPAALFFITLERGRRHILICRAETKVHISGIMRAAKFQRLLDELTTRVHEVQAKLASATAAKTSELPQPETPVPPEAATTADEPSPGEATS